MSEHVLVNLRGQAVELHLPDRVIILGPWESVEVDATGGQVAELERRGLVELRARPEAASRDTPQRRPRRTRPREDPR